MIAVHVCEADAKLLCEMISSGGGYLFLKAGVVPSRAKVDLQRLRCFFEKHLFVMEGPVATDVWAQFQGTSL